MAEGYERRSVVISNSVIYSEYARLFKSLW